LTFYLADHPQALELRQWGHQLLIFRRVRGSHGHVTTLEMDLDHVFQRGKSVWLTITSGPRGTSVYLNGELVQSAGGSHLPENAFAGELVLGSSPITYDPWSGDVSALALYRSELSAGRVRQHYQTGIPTGLSLEDLQNAVAVYGFAEHDGPTIHNEVADAPSLTIPGHFQVPHKPLLLVPWKEIDPLWTYIDDIVAGTIAAGVGPQTRQALTNLAAVLAAAGSSFDLVVRASVFLRDASMFSEMDAVFSEFFSAGRPARTTVPGLQFKEGTDVEIDLVAVVPD